MNSPPGKIIMDMNEFNAALKIARAVREHPIAGKLLSEPGTAAGILQWKHPGTGTDMKARPDWVTESGKIVSIKICEDARPMAFSWNIWNHLHHLQAYVNTEGVFMITGKLCPFIFIAVEKDLPNGIMVYELDEHSISAAASEVYRCIRLYEQCIASDNWPAYPADLQFIALPPWATQANSGEYGKDFEAESTENKNQGGGADYVG